MNPTEAAIRRIARREAGTLLGEAIAEARRRATNQLADQLAEAMVHCALEPSDEPGPERAPVEPRGSVGRYAYAITGPKPLDPGHLSGLRGHRVEAVERDGLRLIVSDIPLAVFERLEVDDLAEGSELAELARKHDEVIRAVAEQLTVLPLRFGTVVPDDAAAERLLAERAGRARALLEELRGRREWGVRVTIDERAVEQAGATEPERTAARPTGTEYLAGRRAALDAAQQRRERTTAVLTEAFQALAKHSSDSVRRDGREGLLLDGAFLVAVAEEEPFHAEVRVLTERLGEQGLLLETTGPWPPYSFARIDVTAASAQAAAHG
jgi:hypothetical protein